MIAEVWVFQNGMAMVFDDHGAQMPEYQGPIEEVRERLAADAPPMTCFYVGERAGGRAHRATRGEALGAPPTSEGDADAPIGARGQGAGEQAKREQAEAAARDANWHADQEKRRRAAAERTLSATKGQVTRLKKRMANGVCPCCRRSFVNLQRHMKGQHPGFVEGDEICPGR